MSKLLLHNSVLPKFMPYLECRQVHLHVPLPVEAASTCRVMISIESKARRGLPNLLQYLKLVVSLEVMCCPPVGSQQISRRFVRKLLPNELCDILRVVEPRVEDYYILRAI
jgi:hypothetical protein